MSVEVTSNELTLKFGGRLVEQLGAQMYPSATATVAELISNAWDADARTVWVEMPFGDWEHGEIIVTDDGHGMNHNEAQNAYLIVGRNRRAGGRQRSPGERLVHGRKGIGKLAAFGTATILELKTRRAGEPVVSFRLDYNKIRHQEPDVPYVVESSTDTAELANPFTGEVLTHGTRIRLTGLRLKRRLNKEQFLRSMSRRFALSEREMVVYVNDEKLPRFELDLDVRFPRDRVPPDALVEGDWAIERLSNGEEVKWWIGFTPTPLRGEAEQGVSVLVRGKLAQRPFKFEQNTGGGTTGQLGQEYLVGEVIADWIDDEHPDDSDEADLIQSNRDQLQLEETYLNPFLDWGRRRLRWALEERNKVRSARASAEIRQFEPLKRMFEIYSARERNALFRVAEEVRRLPGEREVDIQQLVRVMEAVVDTRETQAVRALTHEMAIIGTTDQARFWTLLHQLADLDARSARTFVEARVETLEQLRAIRAEVDLGERIRKLLFISPGILDPTWDSCEVGESALGLAGNSLTASFEIRNRSRPQERTLIVVLEDTPEPTIGDTLRSSLGVDGAHVIVVVDDGDRRGGDSHEAFVTWSSLLQRSEDLHRAWLEVLRSRVTNAQEDLA